MRTDNMNNDNGKILMATLAGIGAGIAAGILLAPKNGQANRDDLKRTLTKAGDDINTTLKGWTENLKSKMGKNAHQDDDQLVMHGSWEDVKRQLSQNYAELTEEDLSYQQGSENELLSRLQARLNKTKDEVLKLLADLRG
ncbi:gas vesicle protein [Pontibacter aydingkolensis]|uniref:YtxH domain-containing protein n=1 Tax=Pontibacter aydingkolensis TaxID=1911536 RepID=A0ABS7CRC1_9BACT|nr:YtxH domain-containing protein [Pontibacter aydingkolensis]MBW7466397.1 YtxH domain-containing protein [Pontibacter aydingkolensis]